jgi:spore maturation protein CgeB
MKIAILTYLYPEMIDYLYKLFPNLHEQNHLDQKGVIDNHISIWASGWEKVLEEQNIPVLTIPTNIPMFLRKWAEENNFTLSDKVEIIIEMLKRFLPDVLFYDLYDHDLLKQIKSNIPSIKLIALWKGSPPVDMEIFKHVDLTISCAPEEVEHLRDLGMKAEHLHHAFNKNILDNQKLTNKQHDVIFIGQIFKSIGFHINRDLVLNKLVKELKLDIFSRAYDLSVHDFALHFSKKTILTLLLPFYLSANKISGKYKSELEKSLTYPITPYSLHLKNFLRAPVYGKIMYDVIKKAKVVLNIHADSSPVYASNMRLFETTGIGSCLLTDWKINMNELFKEDTEVVTFRSEQDCVDKAKWLLSHDAERNNIALGGQKRVFSSHLYEHRLPEFLNIIQKHLK